jgi:hypothetical protein
METKPQAKRDQKLLGRTTTLLGWATPSLGRQTQPTLTKATVDGAESGENTKRSGDQNLVEPVRKSHCWLLPKLKRQLKEQNKRRKRQRKTREEHRRM